MNLEYIDEVLKENVSNECNTKFLTRLILNEEEYSKLYEECMDYDEFEKRVLNKGCSLGAVYSMISLYGKDCKNHWYRIRSLFGERCFKTVSDVGSVLVGNEMFQVYVPNGYGDGITRVAVFNKDDEDYVADSLISMMMDDQRGPVLNGNFNIYPYDCCNPTVAEPCESLVGRYATYYYDDLVAFIEW